MGPDTRGSLWMSASMMGFAVEDALFKGATATVSPGVGTLIFGATGLALYVGAARAAGEAVWSPLYLRPWLIARTLSEVAGRLFFALALAFAPLATTSAILQAAPLIVTLGAAVVLRERVGPLRWAAMTVGFLGVCLILRPWGADFEPSLIFALLGTIGFSCRDLATRASPPELGARQLGILGFAVVVTAGLVICTIETSRAPDARATGLLLAAGAVGVLAYGAITMAMRTGDVSVVSPFRYTRLLAALAIAYVLFGERPDALTYAGALLIVGSGLFTLMRARRAGGST